MVALDVGWKEANISSIHRKAGRSLYKTSPTYENVGGANVLRAPPITV